MLEPAKLEPKKKKSGTDYRRSTDPNKERETKSYSGEGKREKNAGENQVGGGGGGGGGVEIEKSGGDWYRLIKRMSAKKRDRVIFVKVGRKRDKFRRPCRFNKDRLCRQEWRQQAEVKKVKKIWAPSF